MKQVQNVQDNMYSLLQKEKEIKVQA